MTSAETNRKPPFQTGLSSNKIYDLMWVEVRVKYNHWLSSTAHGSNIFCLSPWPFNGGGVVVLNADVLTRNTDVRWEERLSHSCMFLFGSLVGKSCPTLATPWTVARQAPLFMGFSRQEYWEVSHSVMSGSLQPHGLSPQGSSIHGILEWVANSFSRGSSQLRVRTLVSCIAGILLHSRWILNQWSHQGKLFRSKKIFAKIPSPDSLSWLIGLDLVSWQCPDQHWKEW